MCFDLLYHCVSGSMFNENGVQQGSTLDRNHWKMFNIKYIFPSNKTNCSSMRNFFIIDGCFNCVTSRAKALGWLKKEVEENEFRTFQVGHLE